MLFEAIYLLLRATHSGALDAHGRPSSARPRSGEVSQASQQGQQQIAARLPAAPPRVLASAARPVPLHAGRDVTSLHRVTGGQALAAANDA